MTCDLNRSEDQRQILDAAAAMLQAAYPVSRKRETQEDDMAEVAAFGAFALALPEDAGGSGFSLVEEALVHVLFGRHLVSTRALAAALSARLALAKEDADLAAGFASGAATVCAAVPRGDTMLLVDGAGADRALVFGAGELTLVDLGGLARDDIEGMGHAAPLQAVAANPGGTLASSEDTGLLALRDLLVSAQLLGVAEAARDLAVGYAQVRQQFGQPIGGFQAIKHHCADMAIRAELVSAQLDMAAIALRDGREDAIFQVGALRHLAGDAALANARASIQVHGGIGFSAEADIHHYLKHGHVLARLSPPADLLGPAAPLAPRVAMQERS